MEDDDNAWAPYAVLLIDVQRDFWNEPMSMPLGTFERNIGRLLGTCREEGIDVVHLRAAFDADGGDWMTAYKLRGQIPCIRGTAGAEALECAAAIDGETVIGKQTFDGFRQPQLDAWLGACNKRFLLVAGLVTSVCVLLTAAAAAQRGYLVAVIDDCCADTPDAHAHTLTRYPFIFSRTTVERICADRPGWDGDLRRLASP